MTINRRIRIYGGEGDERGTGKKENGIRKQQMENNVLPHHCGRHEGSVTLLCGGGTQKNSDKGGRAPEEKIRDASPGK